jgi:ribosomal protein L29
MLMAQHSPNGRDSAGKKKTWKKREVKRDIAQILCLHG